MFLTWLNDTIDLFNPYSHIFAYVAEKINLGIIIFGMISLSSTEVHPERHLIVEMLSNSLLYIA